MVVYFGCFELYHFVFVFVFFSFQLVCVTNFQGEERMLVKRMLLQIGAQYTGYMTRSNSLLIAKTYDTHTHAH